MLKPSFRTLAHRWWPVLVWLGVIRLESTDFASASNTSGVLYTVIAAVAPHVDESFVSRLDEILRKTGHFAGYGILSALVFLALKNTNYDRLRSLSRRTWGTCLRDFWRWDWVLLAMLLTVVTAAADEIHQSFIPSRTGAWQDVLLDSCGAAVLQVIIYLLSLRAFNRRRARVEQPELSSA
ncbi:MAG: VanZ family protein [Candidatus Korobacteraceae bacterium]